MKKSRTGFFRQASSPLCLAMLVGLFGVIDARAQEDVIPLETRPAPQSPESALQAPGYPEINRLVEEGIFPERALAESTPIRRGEFARIMVELLNHDRTYVSEFPFYRDVPSTHPNYVDIEILRERGLIPNTQAFSPDGFFFPDRPVTNGEAYWLFNRAIAGKVPDPETAESLLEPYEGVDEIPQRLRPFIAKLVNARVIPIRSTPDTIQDLNAPLSFPVLAEMTERLRIIMAGLRIFLPKDEAALPFLPAGTSLSIVPNNALFKARLGVGNHVFFSTVEDTPQVPRGSRVTGVITERLDFNTFIVSLNQVQTVDEKFYRVEATLSLEFGPSEDAFIVPGEPYTVITAVPPVSKEIPGLQAIPASSPGETPANPL